MITLDSQLWKQNSLIKISLNIKIGWKYESLKDLSKSRAADSIVFEALEYSMRL